MAGSDTIYRIQVLYETKDKASSGLEKIGQGAGQAAKQTGGLVDAIKSVGAALVGFGALKMGKSVFIDFNSSIEQSTISLAAQEKMLLGGRWDTAMTHANSLFADYQQVAKASVGETKDFLEMHQMIASSAYQAGLGMKQLKEMTIGATIAAAALGERADVVALDVKQMLAGTVGARDRTAQIFLASQGISQDKFNHSDAKKRAKITMAALNDPALKSAATAMGESFAGVTSTLKDNLQIALGKIGLPLFKQITAEVAKWNTWIEKNPDKIRQWAADFTNGLMEAFGYVKQIAGFIVDNRDLLLMLAKAYLVGKGASLVASTIGGGVQGVAGFAAGIAKLGGEGAGSLAALGTAVSGITAIVGVSAAAAYSINEHEKAMEWRKAEATGNWGTVRRGMEARSSAQLGGSIANGILGLSSGGSVDAIAMKAGAVGAVAALQRKADARMLYEARGDGYIKDGRVDEDAVWKVGSAAGIMVPEIKAYIDTLNGLLSNAAWATGARALAMFNEEIGRLPTVLPKAMAALADPLGLVMKGIKGIPNLLDPNDKTKTPKPNVNINQRNEITVMTDDPDRFSVALTDVALDALKNPRGARTVVREG